MHRHRRPPTQTYARVPKRAKLHHHQSESIHQTQCRYRYRSHTDDPQELAVAVARRGTAGVDAVKGTGDDGEREEEEEDDILRVASHCPVAAPVRVTSAGVMTVGEEGGLLIEGEEGRREGSEMRMGQAVLVTARQRTIESYFVKLPETDEKRGEMVAEKERLEKDDSAGNVVTANGSITAKATMSKTPTDSIDTSHSIKPTAKSPSVATTSNNHTHDNATLCAPGSLPSAASSPPCTVTTTTTTTIPPPASLPSPSPSPSPSSSCSPSPPPACTATPLVLPRRKSKYKPKARLVLQPTAAQSKKLTQLHLDLGQPPLRTTCPICSMSYDPSTPEDSSLHKRFHARSVGGVDYPMPPPPQASSPPRILWSGFGNITKAWHGKEREIVVVVDRRSTKSDRRKIGEIMEVVEGDLGCQKIKEDELWGAVAVVSGCGGATAGGSCGGAGSGGDSSTVRGGMLGTSEIQAGRYKVYLYLLGRKCIGLCLAERIAKAYRVIFTPSAHSPTSNNNTTTHNHNTLTLAKDPQPALLGISRIWTCTTYRRRGVATRLLECARENFIYGTCVEKKLVAFSQPTVMGQALAGAWWSVTGAAPHGVAVVKVGKGRGVGECGEEKEEEEEERKGGWAVYLDEDLNQGA